MKTIFTSILLLFISFQSYSQDITNIDDALYKCKYLLTYQPDSTDINNINSEEMLLLIGRKNSKFLSLSTHLKDSIIRKIDDGSINSLNLMALFRNIPKTKFNDKVFKNYPKNKITVTEHLLKDDYKYVEPIKLFDWKIINEYKTISEYNCQMATTSYAGRDYIAWFTTEIPISDGPYKFNGLPGLIIQINDTKNHYEYELVSLKKQDSNNKIGINKKNYITVTKKEFYKLNKEFYKNIFKKLEQSGISIDLNSSEKKGIINKYKKRNNPIELKLN